MKKVEQKKQDRGKYKIVVGTFKYKKNAEIHVYDPMVSVKKIHNDIINLWDNQKLKSTEKTKLLNNIKTHDNLNSSIRDSNAVAILTEWDEFENYDWSNLLLSSRGSFKIFDGRNILKNKYNNSSITFLG